MRIDAYNQIAQLYNVQKSTKTQGVKQTSYTTADQVSISSIGRDFKLQRVQYQKLQTSGKTKWPSLKQK